MVCPPDWVRPIWLGMRFCRTYTFKKTDPGQLNAARDLWFYSALRMSFCGCIWAGSVTGFLYSLRWGSYDPGNAWDF